MKAILTWHSVDDSGSVISVTAAQLERHLDWLAAGRVRVVPLSELLSAPSDDDAVAVTFDDGFANFSTVAAPLLHERGLAATVFIVPSRVGDTNAWDAAVGAHAIPSLPLMTWDDIRSVAAQGFEIGGHGLTHAPLAGIGALSLTMEIDECSFIIEASTGKRPSSFSYPYGKWDRATVAAVSKSYSNACTTRFDVVTELDHPHELPRLDTYYFRDNRILEEWGTTRFGAYVKLRQAGRTVKSAVNFAANRQG